MGGFLEEQGLEREVVKLGNQKTAQGEKEPCAERAREKRMVATRPRRPWGLGVGNEVAEAGSSRPLAVPEAGEGFGLQSGSREKVLVGGSDSRRWYLLRA